MRIKTGDVKYKDGEVYLETSCTYIQNSDGNEAGDDVQELTIRPQDCGGGIYYVLETKRWAVDNLDDFIKIIEDYKKRIG